MGGATRMGLDIADIYCSIVIGCAASRVTERQFREAGWRRSRRRVVLSPLQVNMRWTQTRATKL
jgi:hypothetical protein